MPLCCITGGGDFAPERLPVREPDDLFIAADSGYLALKNAGVVPDLCVGDFDSMEAVPTDCPVVRLPVRKDDTDIVAAARIGLSRGYRRFLFLGTLGGGRFSHSMATVQTLAWLAEQGAEATAADGRCTATVLKDGAVDFPAGERGSLSLFALSETARVTLRGFLYPLEEAEVRSTFPLGVSNAFTSGPAHIAVKGTALLVREENIVPHRG